MDEAVKVDGSSIVACGEAAEMLEAIEAAFNAVAVFVGVGVVRDEQLARAVGGITASARMSAVTARKALLS
jgi:hypothetical protein